MLYVCLVLHLKCLVLPCVRKSFYSHISFLCSVFISYLLDQQSRFDRRLIIVTKAVQENMHILTVRQIRSQRWGGWGMPSADPRPSILLRQIGRLHTRELLKTRPVDQTVVDGSLLQHTGQRMIIKGNKRLRFNRELDVSEYIREKKSDHSLRGNNWI